MILFCLFFFSYIFYCILLQQFKCWETGIKKLEMKFKNSFHMIPMKIMKYKLKYDYENT